MFGLHTVGHVTVNSKQISDSGRGDIVFCLHGTVHVTVNSKQISDTRRGDIFGSVFASVEIELVCVTSA